MGPHHGLHGPFRHLPDCIGSPFRGEPERDRDLLEFIELEPEASRPHGGDHRVGLQVLLGDIDVPAEGFQEGSHHRTVLHCDPPGEGNRGISAQYHGRGIRDHPDDPVESPEHPGDLGDGQLGHERDDDGIGFECRGNHTEHLPCVRGMDCDDDKVLAGCKGVLVL